MQIQPLISSLLQGASAALSVAASGAVPRAAGRANSPSVDATDSAEAGSSRFDTNDELELSPEAQQAARGQLSEEEQQQVQELRQRDREVRAHEQAHLSAAGAYARGGPTFQYQQGPDGQRYAVGGEVSIDTSPVSGDPEATIRKAQVIRAAASAPAEPSAQDRKVAAAATKMEAQARQELREKQRAERRAETEGEDPATAGGQIQLQNPTGGATFSLGFHFDAVA